MQDINTNVNRQPPDVSNLFQNPLSKDIFTVTPYGGSDQWK
jgi:hypothetical protein